MAKDDRQDNGCGISPGAGDAGDYRVFDRRAVRRNRERAAAGFDDHAFLIREIADRMAERLMEINRPFARALDLGSHDGAMIGHLRRRGSELVVATDLAPAFAATLAAPRLVADEELLPFADDSFDLVTSVLSLHWANDLPGTLLQVRRALRPDGLFLGAIFGAETLRELRQAFLEAESLIEGGVSPRVSPFTDIRLAGALMQRAGFALPVVDSDTITVTYPDALSLMRDLKGMGEANAHLERRQGFTRRRTLMTVAEAYHARHGLPDGRIPATFQILYLTGWKPHEGQQKPLRPGSGKVSLTQVLGNRAG